MTEKKQQIIPLQCPVCNISTNYIYRVDSGDGNADWYRCNCGVIFQEKVPDQSSYDSEYMKNYISEDIRENHEHAAYTYSPIIEELTYGRMMLDVGFGGCGYNMEYFSKRGWLTWGIDCNSAIKPGGNIYKGDFLTYDFSLSSPDIEAMTGQKVIERKIDLIWMSHFIEHVQYPLENLRKAYDLLSETGVLYISTPSIDFISKTGVIGFPHWKNKEHYIMWTEEALKREVERLGFKVILSRRNYATRYGSWYDIHLICQKRYM